MSASGGRPRGTTAREGYQVSVSGGRPKGTTATDGYGVSGGRPRGTTAIDGYGVSGGRPRGTTAIDGYGVSGGRPKGTTASEGYGVFHSGGRPKGRNQDVPFIDNISLPSDWDVSAVNLSPELLTACCQRIKQQRTFDLKPLGVGVCYMCGHVLWSSVDGAHTFLVDKPTNMTAAEAPASAYLRAVPNCTLSFQYTERGSSTKERWYCCGHCRNDTVPTEQHVGDIFGDDVCDVKPVLLWDMTMPEPIKALCNKYETGMVSLCGLFSDTVKKASMSQYQHLQGEVNAIKNLTGIIMVSLGLWQSRTVISLRIVLTPIVPSV